jgi:hypothetical protein
MKCLRVLLASAVALVAVGVAAAASAPAESVPLYTGDDLDRMFGPAPRGPSDPVDKSGPDDWRFVEQFLDRQYSRIDADRSHDLDSRSLDIASRRLEPAVPAYYGAVAWGLGYPASTWWQRVRSGYSAGGSAYYGRGRHPEFSTMPHDHWRHGR